MTRRSSVCEHGADKHDCGLCNPIDLAEPERTKRDVKDDLHRLRRLDRQNPHWDKSDEIEDLERELENLQDGDA